MKAFEIILLCLISGSSFSQTPESADTPKPREPLVSRMPAQSAWTIAFSYNSAPVGGDAPSQGAKNNPTPENQRTTKTEIIKNGTIYREKASFNSGRTGETWSIGSLVVSNFYTVIPVPVDSGAMGITNFKKSDFDDVAWITMSQFKGVVDYKGRKAFLFSGEGGKRKYSNRESGLIQIWRDSQGEAPKPAFLTGESRVYLDVATQVPIAFDNGEFTGIYAISAKPPSTLVMPKDFQDVMRERIAFMKAYGSDPTKSDQ